MTLTSVIDCDEKNAIRRNTTRNKRPVTSATSSDNETIFPFAFTEPPKIPHIDTYVQNDHLKTRNLVRYSNPVRKVDDYHISSPPHPILRNPSLHRFHESDSTVDQIPYDDDTKSIIKFVRLCGNCTADYITLRDLETAFRKCKRNPDIDLTEVNEKVQLLLEEVESNLNHCYTTPTQWFINSIRNKRGHYDKTLTWHDFKYGIRSLRRDVGLEPMEDGDVLSILHYFDPNSQGYITLTDFAVYFEQDHKAHPQKLAMKDASHHMLHILELIHNRQMRIRDLFRSLDPDHHNRVSVRLLAAGLHKMFLDDDALSQSGVSVSSSFSKTKSLVSRNENGELKLPFIGGTESSNKMFLERLKETKQKLDDSNFQSDPKIISPMISSKQRSFRMPLNSVPIKRPFEIEAAKLVKSTLQKDNSECSSPPENDDHPHFDDHHNYDEDSFTSQSKQPSKCLSKNVPRLESERQCAYDKDYQSTVPCSLSGASRKQDAKGPMRKMNPARHANHMAAINAHVEEESKIFDAWVDQFDKKVEVYLKRLHRI